MVKRQIQLGPAHTGCPHPPPNSLFENNFEYVFVFFVNFDQTYLTVVNMQCFQYVSYSLLALQKRKVSVIKTIRRPQEFHLIGSKILGAATDGLQFSKTFQAPHPYSTLWHT